MKKIPNAFSNTLDHITAYLNSSDNIITNISRINTYNDYPFFYQYATAYKPRRNNTKADLIANGLSLNRHEAIGKAVMETIERWYLNSYEEKNLLYGTYHDLKEKRMPVIDPRIFQFFSKKQLTSSKYKKFMCNESSFLYWVEVSAMNSKNPIIIPAQCIYFLDKMKQKNSLLFLPDSTGAAAGSSLDQALYNGICELVERDAYAITYYNKLSAEKIICEEIDDEDSITLFKHIEDSYFKVHLFDISLDISLPVILCVLVDEIDNIPKISIGVKCSMNWNEAIYGAMIESLQSITSTRDLSVMQKTMTQKNFNHIGGAIKPIMQRMLYWGQVNSVKDIAFLLNSPHKSIGKVKYRTVKENRSYTELLNLVIDELGKQEINTIYWKQTTPFSLNQFSLYGVKVVIPQLASVPLDGSYYYFGKERIFSVPVKMGIKKNPLKEIELNTIPHPLP